MISNARPFHASSGQPEITLLAGERQNKLSVSFARGNVVFDSTTTVVRPRGATDDQAEFG